MGPGLYGGTGLVLLPRMGTALSEISETRNPELVAHDLPSRKGVNADAVLAFIDDVEASKQELHSLIIWRDGAIVVEGYKWPYGHDRLRILHSVTKSFTACAIGLLIEEGRLALSDRVGSLFPEFITAADTRLDRMTVEDLLTMRTGHAEEVSGSLWRGIKTSWTAEFFKIPVEHDPGTVHVYSSAASYMLSAIVTRVTGETLHDYLRPRLFVPLGITSETWDVGPDGFSPGGNGFSALLSDALKLGILHAQRGVWNGRQILSARWVAAATAPQGAADYGYHWVIGEGYFAAIGVFVQAILVYPAEGVVIVVAGAMEESAVLLPHLKRHFPQGFQRGAAAESDERLAQRLRAWREVPALGSVADGGRIDGDWIVDPNALGISSLRFTFQGSTLSLSLEDGEGSHRIDSMMDGWRETRSTMPGAELHHGYRFVGAPVVAGGHWVDHDKLELIWHFVESAFRDTVTVRLEGDRLSFDRRVNVNSGAKSWPTLSARRA